MTKQLILCRNSFRLLWRTKVIDEVENFLSLHLICNADCFQVFVVESEENIQVDLKLRVNEVKFEVAGTLLPLLCQKLCRDRRG